MTLANGNDPMSRIEIDKSGIGGRKEHWWDLTFDDETGEFFIEHSWHEFRIRGRNREGSESMPLSEAATKDRERYEKAVQIIKSKLFGQ